MMPIVSPAPCARPGATTKSAFVKLLETVTGPSAAGLVAMDGHGMGLTERAMSNRTGAIMIAAALLCSSGQSQAQSQAQSSGNGISNFLGQHLLRPEIRPGAAGRARPGRRPAALERRGRRLRPSPDDRFRDPGGGGELSKLRRLDVARCRTAQHHAGKFRALHRRPRARPAHHGPDGFAARIHQGDLGLSRHPRERQPPRQGPRDPRQIQAAVRRGGESLRRRPLRDRVDLGHRVRTTRRRWATATWCNSTATLACVGRRQAYFKDEFLTALEILNRGDLRPEQMRGSWAGAFGPTQFMPTAFKRYAVDGDGDGRRDVVDNRRRPDRLDRQQPQEGRLADRPDLGLRGGAAGGLQFHAGGQGQGDDDRAMAAARA